MAMRSFKTYHPSDGIKKRLWYRLLHTINTFGTILLFIITTLIAYILLDSGHEVNIVGQINGDFFQCFKLPEIDIEMWGEIFGSCVLMAMLSFLESYSVAYKFSLQNGYTVDASQELVALGSASVFAGFSSGFAAGGAFGRTALAADSGARTPFYNLYIGVIVIIVLGAASDLIHYVPKSTLAAIIQVSVLKLVDLKEFVEAYRVDKNDFVVMVVTALATLFLSVEVGLAFGLVVSFVMLLRDLAEIHTSLLGAMQEGGDEQQQLRLFRSLSQYSQAVELDTVKVRVRMGTRY